MHSDDGQGLSREVALLENLEEDLRALESSWNRKGLPKKKVLRHFTEIMTSVLDTARSEMPEELDAACAQMQDFLKPAAGGRPELDASSWVLTFDLIKLLKESLRDGAVEPEAVEQWLTNWERKAVSQAESPEPPKEPSVQEESEMADTLQAEANELLAKAQQALSSGNGDNAKELALKAAEIIARIEAEEARKRENVLRVDLEMAAHEEAEAEETFKLLKDEMASRDSDLVELDNRLSHARASLEQQQKTSHELKKQIDEVEAELESLKEKHKQLIEQYQVVLPARDAAERECIKLKEEIENLHPEVETLADNIGVAESQFMKARQKRESIEAELEKLKQKATSAA